VSDRPIGNSEAQASRAEDALARWKQGHQAFHVYLVAMNSVIRTARRQAMEGDDEPLGANLMKLSALYDAATATMVYASDFPPALYETTVRPSMSPPELSPGFSGVLNTEHNVMVDELADLGRSLCTRYGGDRSTWPVAVNRSWRAVERSKSRNLASHFRICRRFVPEGASLLREFLQKAGR
jgi:hypothetical protein